MLSKKSALSWASQLETTVQASVCSGTNRIVSTGFANTTYCGEAAPASEFDGHAEIGGKWRFFEGQAQVTVR